MVYLLALLVSRYLTRVSRTSLVMCSRFSLVEFWPEFLISLFSKVHSQILIRTGIAFTVAKYSITLRKSIILFIVCGRKYFFRTLLLLYGVEFAKYKH